jgi:hypothetical protein
MKDHFKRDGRLHGKTWTWTISILYFKVCLYIEGSLGYGWFHITLEGAETHLHLLCH